MIAKTFSSGNVTVNIHDVCFSDRAVAEKCAGRALSDYYKRRISEKAISVNRKIPALDAGNGATV